MSTQFTSRSEHVLAGDYRIVELAGDWNNGTINSCRICLATSRGEAASKRELLPGSAPGQSLAKVELGAAGELLAVVLLGRVDCLELGGALERMGVAGALVRYVVAAVPADLMDI